MFMKRENIMLCMPTEHKKILKMPTTNEDTGEKSFFHQPKLKGERCRVEWFRDSPILISSYGNEFRFLEHIQADVFSITRQYGKQLKLDGEIYKHGWTQERINSAANRTKNRNDDAIQLEYHIFDYQDEIELQWQRIHELNKLVETASVKVVETGICNQDNYLTFAEDDIENGYEGTVYRNPFGLYVLKRSIDCQKFKPTEKDAYIIRGVTEAVSIEGEPKGMVGAFIVQAHDEPSDVTFRVGAGKMKHDERIRHWLNRDMLNGKILVVKQEPSRTVNKIPVAAVAVEVTDCWATL